MNEKSIQGSEEPQRRERVLASDHSLEHSSATPPTVDNQSPESRHLLCDRRIGSSVNSSVRASAIRAMQHSVGNRALQRSMHPINPPAANGKSAQLGGHLASERLKTPSSYSAGTRMPLPIQRQDASNVIMLPEQLITASPPSDEIVMPEEVITASPPASSSSGEIMMPEEVITASPPASSGGGGPIVMPEEVITAGPQAPSSDEIMIPEEVITASPPASSGGGGPIVMPEEVITL